MLLANSPGAESAAKTFHLEEATISDVRAAYLSGALTPQNWCRRIWSGSKPMTKRGQSLMR